MMAMDNFSLYVEGDAREAVEHAVRIAFMAHSKAVSYIDFGDMLVLFWHPAAQTVPLPYAVTGSSAEHVLWQWLATKAKWTEPQPDIDGSVSKGWIVRAGEALDTALRKHNFEHGDFYAVVSIEPTWALHSK